MLEEGAQQQPLEPHRGARLDRPALAEEPVEGEAVRVLQLRLHRLVERRRRRVGHRVEQVVEEVRVVEHALDGDHRRRRRRRRRPRVDGGEPPQRRRPRAHSADAKEPGVDVEADRTSETGSAPPPPAPPAMLPRSVWMRRGARASSGMRSAERATGRRVGDADGDDVGGASAVVRSAEKWCGELGRPPPRRSPRGRRGGARRAASARRRRRPPPTTASGARGRRRGRRAPTRTPPVARGGAASAPAPRASA